MAINSCDKWAADAVKPSNFEIKRHAGTMKPISPMRTATCIMCFRNPSFRDATYPSSISTTPNAAGINAVRLAFPCVIP